MGKCKTPEVRAAKEARMLEKLSKKSKKGDSSKPTDTQERTSGIVLMASESHDALMEGEPANEEVKKENKLSRKRRLEQEEGLMDATVDTTAAESPDAPKKRRKHKRAEEGEPADSIAVVVDEVAADLDVEKIASSSRKGDKKSKKEKTRKGEDLAPAVEEHGADCQFPADGPSSESASIKDGKNKKKQGQEISNEEDTSSSPKKKKSKSKSGSTSKSSPTSPPNPRKNRTDFPDPHADESLTDQARKALDYAFLQFNKPSEWKFNKAKQNWLIRNVWSSEAIPDNYLRLATKYLTQVQGGSRDKLQETCKAAIAEPLPSPAPANDEPKDTKPSDTPEEADDSSKRPKSILRGPAHPIAGAIVASVPEAPKVTVDTKKLRAQALIEALGFSSR